MLLAVQTRSPSSEQTEVAAVNDFAVPPSGVQRVHSSRSYYGRNSKRWNGVLHTQESCVLMTWHMFERLCESKMILRRAMFIVWRLLPLHGKLKQTLPGPWI